MGIKRAITDYVKGQYTVGNCDVCGHGATAAPGCACKASWCPCHKAFYGHSAHRCSDRPEDH
ncbi:hypothetical protein ACFWYW_58550 [Nonomuraea sp. NPDC059023]|uniref:hypothetical protein n=1 Tax=unclassified Nonomuraea TaxID=2593643 RepID=UPI00368BE288